MSQVKLEKTEVLSDNHYVLKQLHFELQKKDGSWEKQKREVFDHGDAATVLLYNKEERKVILTKQFRIATYVNGNPTGMLMETCAGLLEENEDPQITILREIEEETGYRLQEVQKVYEAYTSAGSLTEKLFFYIAPYQNQQKVNTGGGLEEEGEDIQVIEMPFDEALQLLEKGEINDAKTIILLQYVQLKGIL